MKVDIAIIGAGPAGAMAACELAKSGLTIVILDKHTLPREKPCGGLMPGGVSHFFSWSIDHLVEHRVAAFQFFRDFQQPCRKTISPGQLLLVNRATFDAGLVQWAVEAGHGSVSLFECYSVESVVEGEHSVHISSAGKPDITADYVIAGDGVNSRTARCIGLNQSRVTAAAVEANVQVSDVSYQQHQTSVLFNYFCIPHGYGWIFPKSSGRLNCGLGAWGKPKRLVEAGRRFVSQSLPEIDSETIKFAGYPLPIYSGRASIASQRVCLVGDAASFVDPVSGEGIRFALWSGKLAAQALLESYSEEAQNVDGFGCRLYESMVNETLVLTLEKSLRFASLPFHQAPELYYDRYIAKEDSIPYCLN